MTKKRAGLRPPEHPGRMIAIVAAAVGVIILALVWGSHLKAKSDAYRAAQEAGEWLLDRETVTPLPVSVPDLRAVEITPEGNVGDILIAGKHDGVILPLYDGTGTMAYRFAIGEAAGLATVPDAPLLADDVARVSRRGLRVIGVFTVTCFDAPDTAAFAYRRGLDLAMLYECAAAGVDDILLIGLPAGDESRDRRTLDFLAELKELLAPLESKPAVGVAIEPLALSNGDVDENGRPLYAGNPTPARLRGGCDYMALDLRNHTSEEIGDMLPGLQYAYVRHSLRLLLDREATDTVEDVLSHGFERVFELRPTPEAEDEIY